MQKPSKYHNNRKSYNWLAYDNGDKWLLEYSKHYKGILIDLGCGTAPYKDFFLQYADKYVGVDWTKTLHNSKADVISNLNESYRILKDNGTIILQVPFMWWVHEAPYDYFRYTPYGLKYMFEKAGYKDIHIQPTSGFFTMWFLKMNYFSLKWIKGSKIRRSFTRGLLIPFWYLSQKLAPWLDSKHRGWSLESAGFFVVAKK